MYSKKRLYERAVKLIESDSEVIHAIDVYSLLGIGQDTFLKYFPPESKERIAIEDMLATNRSRNTHERRQMWRMSAEPTLQIAYYKLNATEAEKESLGIKTQNTNTDNKTIKLQIP